MYPLIFWYNILFTCVAALCVDFSLGILKFIIRRKKIFFKFIGVNIFLGLLGITVFYLLTTGSWKDLHTSDGWAYMYLIAFCIDFFVVNPFLCLLKCCVIYVCIDRKRKFFRFIRWILVFWEEEIYFRKPEWVSEESE